MPCSSHHDSVCYNPAHDFIALFIEFTSVFSSKTERAKLRRLTFMATEMKRSSASIDRVEELLGDEARTLLDHKSSAIPKSQLHLPGPDFVDRVCAQSDRPPAVLRALQSLLGHGRLAGTGYVSILPVDQGIEH